MKIYTQEELKEILKNHHEWLTSTGGICADLSDANLSGAKELLDSIKYIEKNFEKTEEGIIVYKSFGVHYTPNPNWEIAEGSIIEEVVNPLPTVACGCGVNVATKEWAERECNN